MLKINIANIEGTRSVIKVRYRIREGRALEICYRSGIETTFDELQKYNADGTLKPGQEPLEPFLSVLLEREYKKINEVYSLMVKMGMAVTSKTFTEQCETYSPCTLISSFFKYADTALEQGVVTQGRYKHFLTTGNKLERFLTISELQLISPKDFDGRLLARFKDFVKNEYVYVRRYPEVYEGMNERQLPKRALADATLENDMKILCTYFTKLENADEIEKSPFRQLKAVRRREGVEDFGSLKRFVQKHYPEVWNEYILQVLHPSTTL